MKLNTLIRSARASAKWRGHSMKPFLKGETRAVGYCRVCGAYVRVDTKPMPNGIDIAGDAVALNCPVKE